MKIGFLDSIFNYADVFEKASEVIGSKSANVTVERMTAPHLLKIPVCSKMLFSKGCDAVIVFLTILEEDIAELDLIHEKIIDLELQQEKFVFFCIVMQGEYKNEEELNKVMEERLGIIMDATVKLAHSPSELSGDIANESMTNAFSMFSNFATSQEETNAENEVPSKPTEEEGESRSLF